MTTVFPELRWCLPKLIPEGFTLAVGAPKIGKSWLLLQLALAAASGGTVLGEHLVPRPVLYLALEDSDRRLHARAASLGYGVTDAVTLAGFSYLTAIPPGRNVRDLILDWVDAQSDEIAPLVLVDTFGRVKGARATQAESQYDHEYRIGAAFKAIADDVPGMPLVASHHDRKAASTDFVDDVSGTNGLAGSADTILLLRRDRHSDDGVIQVTGRDVEEDAFAVNLSERGKWTLIGGDWTASRSSAIELMATTGRGDLAASIVAWLRTNVSGTPNEIADALGMGNNTIRQSLYRMRRAGVVDSDDRHHHFLPASSNEVAS